MRMIDCPVCGAKRGAKRHIGIGTILGIALTWVVLSTLLSFLCASYTTALGIATFVLIFSWVIAIVSYPVRCIVCGSQEERDKEMKEDRLKYGVVLVALLVLIFAMAYCHGHLGV